MARDDRGSSVLGAFLAAREEFGKVSHDVSAFGLRRLVTSLAVRLKDRPHFFEIADRRVGVIDFIFGGAATAASVNAAQKSGMRRRENKPAIMVAVKRQE